MYLFYRFQTGRLLKIKMRKPIIFFTLIQIIFMYYQSLQSSTCILKYIPDYSIKKKIFSCFKPISCKLINILLMYYYLIILYIFFNNHCLLHLALLSIKMYNYLFIVFFIRNLIIIIIIQMQKSSTNKYFNQQKQKVLSSNQNTSRISVLPLPYLESFRNRLNSFNSYQMTLINLIQAPMMKVIDDEDNYNKFEQKQIQKEQILECNISDDQIQEKNNEDEMNNESESDQFINEKQIVNNDLKGIIQVIIDNLIINDKIIELKKKQFDSQSQILKVFNLLLKKFRKIKKTKEEMVKYCMRKAYKFITDKIKKTTQLKDNTDCLKYYFKEFKEDKSVVIPFKKNSINKTMNIHFLKAVFSFSTFSQDYKKFLSKFKQEIIKDNNKKLKNFLQFIDECLLNKNIKKIQHYKRFPWTQNILDQVEEVANNLHFTYCTQEIRPSENQQIEEKQQIDTTKQKSQQKAHQNKKQLNESLTLNSPNKS